MSLKTEYGFNEDDFVQNGNGMQELTVTITLCEYRNLVKDIAYQDGVIEKLQEENKKLTEQNKCYAEYIVSKNPEIIKQLWCAISGFFNVDVEQPDMEQPEAERKKNNGET